LIKPSKSKQKNGFFMFRRERQWGFQTIAVITSRSPLLTESLQASGERSSHSLKTGTTALRGNRYSGNRGFKSLTQKIPVVFSIAPSSASVYDPFEQFIARWGLSLSGATKTRPIRLFPTTTIPDSVVKFRDRNQKSFFCFVFFAIQRK